MNTSPITFTNNPVQIAPGLTLDDELYAVAAAGVAEHLPELGPLKPEAFFSRRWTLVPDEQTGEAYKAELTLFKTDTRTVKINRWFDDDERDGKGPRPHNHPWDFHSMILGGTYVESRWTKRDGVVVPELDVEHRTGDVNKIGREVFHEVTEVDPDRTLMLMICGPGMSSWGYMDPTSGDFTAAALPAGFLERQAALNPHHQ
ncbi:hypothetical protein [Amycolatopsis magusensis]|uniref:hypothetical protein n=1 Tax=Amycolatopsis magusensis TaxID=882444 RepID=UPI00378A9FAA